MAAQSTSGVSVIANASIAAPPPSNASSPADYTLLEEDMRVTLTLVGSGVILITALGNLLTIYAVKRYRRLQSVQNLYIVSLAVADFVVGAFVMTFMLLYTVTFNGRWVFGRAMCEIWQVADYVSCAASLHSLCAIAADRYVVVSQPLRSMKRTKQKAATTISAIWCWCVVAWVLVIALMRATSGQSPAGTCYLLWRPWYASVIVGSVMIYAPIFTVVALFGATLLEIRAQMKQMNERIRARSVSVNPASGGGAGGGGGGGGGGRGRGGGGGGVQTATSSDASLNTINNSKQDALADIVDISRCLSTNELSNDDDSLYGVAAAATAAAAASHANFIPRLQQQTNGTRTADLAVTSLTCPLPRRVVNGYATYAHSKSVDVSPTNSVTKPPHPPIRKIHSVDVAAVSRVRSRMVKLSLRGGSRGGAADGDILMEYSEEMRSQRQNSIIRSRLSKQIKATKSVGLMMLAVLCCWLPFCVMWPLRSYCPVCIPMRLYEISFWTNYLSSALNPILYQLCHPSFRRAFKRIFQGILQRPFS